MHHGSAEARRVFGTAYQHFSTVQGLLFHHHSCQAEDYSIFCTACCYSWNLHLSASSRGQKWHPEDQDIVASELCMVFPVLAGAGTGASFGSGM